MMKTSDKGIILIKHFEGLHDGDFKKIGLQPKLCPAGIWTVGYGHAVKDRSGKLIKSNMSLKELIDIRPDLITLTEEQAEDLLKKDLLKYEKIVNNRTRGVKLEQHEFDALVSHTYNTGGSSTLFRLVRESPRNWDAIHSWWTSKYITANGIYLHGLQLRRNAEWVLFNAATFNV